MRELSPRKTGGRDESFGPRGEASQTSIRAVDLGEKSRQLGDELRQKSDTLHLEVSQMAARGRRGERGSGLGQVSGGHGVEPAGSDFFTSRDVTRPFWEREEAISRLHRTHPDRTEFQVRSDPTLPLWTVRKYGGTQRR